MTDQLTKTGKHEPNPFRPDIPDTLQSVSPHLYDYLREVAETLREQHNLTQAGDSTFSWELLTTIDVESQFTLGSLGRFYHPTYGLIIARYVQFASMDPALWSGSPVGFLERSHEFAWVVTNQFAESFLSGCVGICGAYQTPIDGSYGWVIVSGANIQMIHSTSEPKQFGLLSWYANEKVAPTDETLGRPVARFFGNRSEAASGYVKLLPGSVFIESLSLFEAAQLDIDIPALEAKIQQLQQNLDSAVTTVNIQLGEADATISQAVAGVNRTAKIFSRRLAAFDTDSIRAEIADTIQLAATYESRTLSAAENAELNQNRSFTNVVVSSEASRFASVKSDEAGIYAETATTQANIATLANSEAGLSAAAAATSEANAAVSETNAGTSAGAASTSATSASTSATNAANSASTASTQAANASTSAGQAATSASQASTSATNAAGSASNASSSATTATNAATTATTQAGTATTQAGIATTQAGVATTQASNASTSASQASTSATNAAGSASSASTSQTAAATSATSAQQVANRLIPERPSIKADFTNATGGTPAAIADATGAVVNIAVEGDVLERVLTTAGITATKGWLSVSSGRTFEVSARSRLTALTGTTNRHIGFICLDSTGAYLGLVFSDLGNWTVAAGWNTATYQTTSTAILAAFSTAAYIRAYTGPTLPGGATCTVQHAILRFTDVTDRVAASTSASAAATSASSASTQASNAAISATAASSSATSASTSASGAASSATTASTQASNAASSATSASGSASTATTQASNSATSATNAASSATSAATSATSASTSASSASTSAILAAQVGIGALNPNPQFADFPTATGVPTSWGDATYSTGLTTLNSSRVTGEYGGYAWRVNLAAGVDNVFGAARIVADVIRGGGFYVIECDLTLNAGSFNGAGFRLYWDGPYDFVITALKDVTGAAIGVGTAGKTYRIRIPWKAPTAALALGFALVQFFFHYSPVGGSVAAALDMTLRRFAIRPVSDMEASVLTNSGVVVDVASRIATANFEAVTVAGSATAALRLDSKAIGGSASSSVALEAEEIQLFNSVAGVRSLAMKIASGSVLVLGDLDVGKGVRIGTRRIPVALQSFQLQAGDGDTVDFGTDLVNLPILIFDTTHLAAKTAAQTYDIRANSLTSSGFTMYAKITTASSPTTLTFSPATDMGSGVTPRYQVNKTNALDASDGYYTFSVTLNLVFGGYDGTPNSSRAYAEFDCYVRPSGGSWTYIGTVAKEVGHTGDGTFAKILNQAMYYAGAIGTDGSNNEFGVVIVAGSYSAFSVSYSATSTSGTSSATPGGEKVIVTVIPQNV